jgi:hypothetical protein
MYTPSAVGTRAHHQSVSDKGCYIIIGQLLNFIFSILLVLVHWLKIQTQLHRTFFFQQDFLRKV